MCASVGVLESMLEGVSAGVLTGHNSPLFSASAFKGSV